MKYALVNNERREAEPKMYGLCPVCDQPVIAKCGEYKINHWAHKAKVDCDKWWEPETEWHRAWKNNFPAEWQEVIMHDVTTGEKHVADVQASDGLVVEFQHSSIKPEEQRSREAFYKKMVWVVDGKRCPTHKEAFSAHYPIRLGNSRYFRRATEAFPRSWRDSTVSVIMDFGMSLEAANDDLYCLLPQKAIMVRITRQEFIKKVTDGTWQTSIENAPKHVEAYFERQRREEQRKADLREKFFDVQDYKAMRDEYVSSAMEIQELRTILIKNNQRENKEMRLEAFKQGIVAWIMQAFYLDNAMSVASFCYQERHLIHQMFEQGATPEIVARILTDPNL